MENTSTWILLRSEQIEKLNSIFKDKNIHENEKSSKIYQNEN